MEVSIADHNIVVDRPNRRIKVMECSAQQLDLSLIEHLNSLEAQTQCSKTIIYAKKAEVPFFKGHGFHQEGIIDGFFSGQNAYMLARFSEDTRGVSKAQKEQDQILKIAQEDPKKALPGKPLPLEMKMRKAALTDAHDLADLYRQVFKSYPTPMHDPEYIQKVMNDDIHFMVIEHHGRIVCAASAEVTRKQKCAELTDCATLPEYRGQSLLSHLFFALEDWLEEQGIYYLFSLTRAQSPGMNITTARHGYEYRGRLINNCDIYSGFEDMNIWVKPLRPTWD